MKRVSKNKNQSFQIHKQNNWWETWLRVIRQKRKRSCFHNKSMMNMLLGRTTDFFKVLLQTWIFSHVKIMWKERKIQNFNLIPQIVFEIWHFEIFGIQVILLKRPDLAFLDLDKSKNTKENPIYKDLMAYMQYIQQEKKEDLAFKTLVCVLRPSKNGSSKRNFDA